MSESDPPSLRRVRYFLEVADRLSFTRAAAALNMAQSPLSQQIRLLEAELGVTLFERSTRSVTLTAAGAAFQTRARGLLTDLDRAVAETRQIATGGSGSVVVGFGALQFLSAVPVALRAVRARAPDLNLDVRNISTQLEPQLQLVRDGTIDVSHGGQLAPAPDGAVVIEQVAQWPLAVVVANDHALADASSVRWAQLREEDLVLPEPPHPLFELATRACLLAGFAPRVRHRVPDVITQLAYASANSGVAVIPDMFERVQFSGSRWIALSDPPQFVYSTLMYRSTETNPAVLRYLEIARAFSAEMSGRGSR